MEAELSILHGTSASIAATATAIGNDGGVAQKATSQADLIQEQLRRKGTINANNAISLVEPMERNIAGATTRLSQSKGLDPSQWGGTFSMSLWSRSGICETLMEVVAYAEEEEGRAAELLERKVMPQSAAGGKLMEVLKTVPTREATIMV